MTVTVITYMFVEDGQECTVTVLLDGEESVIDFIDVIDVDVSSYCHILSYSVTLNSYMHDHY